MPKSYFTRVGDALTQWTAHNWHQSRQKRFNQAQIEMFDAVDGYPKHPTSGMVVFGAGPMSGTIAVQAAKLFSAGQVTERVYFVGGVQITKSSFASVLLPKMARAGHPEPSAQESEAAYMERVFRAELARLNHNAKHLDIRREENSYNTGQNCVMTAALGAKNELSLTLVTLPYHALRTVATWRKQVSNDQPLRPIMAWPERELGINPTNWPESLLALYVVQGEISKILGENASYVLKGFCAVPNPSRDRVLFERPLGREPHMDSPLLKGSEPQPTL